MLLTDQDRSSRERELRLELFERERQAAIARFPENGRYLAGNRRGSTMSVRSPTGFQDKAAPPWLWESFEDHFRLGWESAEFWHAFNSWNRSYWMFLTLIILPANIVLSMLGMDWNSSSLRSYKIFWVISTSVAVALGFAGLVFIPRRGHTVMACMVTFLFVLHYVDLWLTSTECHGAHRGIWKPSCLKTVVLSEPPLFLVIFVFSTCRLRPLWPVLLCGLCSTVPLAFSVATAVRGLFTAISDPNEVSTAIGCYYVGVACIFGAQAGASIFRRQRDIFEFLNDHVRIRRSSEAPVVCEFDGVGDGTRQFFQQYINRIVVRSFPDPEPDEEREFARWRFRTAESWLSRRAHYLIIGIFFVVLPYLWLCWDWYARQRSRFACICVQTAAMVLALASATALKFCTGRWRFASFMVAQLVFSISFLWCGGVAKGDEDPPAQDHGGISPIDPFFFLIFSAHAMWSLNLCRLVMFDIALFVPFVAFLFVYPAEHSLRPHPYGTLSHMLLAMVECMSLTFTFEKYDRILWRLHCFAGHHWETPCGSYANPATFRSKQSAPMLEDIGPICGGPEDAAAAAGQHRGPRASDIHINVVGYATQYSDEVFFYIEFVCLGMGKQVVLQSVPALRAAFLRLFEAQVEVTEVPFFDQSFDGLADETDLRIQHAARRLERILRRSLTNVTLARKVLGIDGGDNNDGHPDRYPLPPRMQVLILSVGSRGDVAPFISLALALNNEGHRCRLATHGEFEGMVRQAGVEFFPLATQHAEHWQPRQLMSYMETNPELGPDMLLRPQALGRMAVNAPDMQRSLQQILMPTQIENTRGHPLPLTEQDHGQRRPLFQPYHGDPEIGPWAAAVQPDPLTKKPFTAQAVIANPPSFAHIHIAEKLGIPCHLAFTCPWTPTSTFGHPMSGPTGAAGEGNAYWQKMSYHWMDHLQWSAGRLGVIVNEFREKHLGLASIGITQNAPSLIDELKVPFMYFFSSEILGKPPDWGPHVDCVGFVHDNSGSVGGTRPAALDAFLAAGPPPLYVGFGSISADLQSIARDVVQAAIQEGCRVVLQHGWGSLGNMWENLPTGVFYVGQKSEEEMLTPLIARGLACVGALDHEWLFPRCHAVCHHGGCGTAHCGMRHACPTIVVAFFADQPLWGSLLQQKGCGRLILARNASRETFQEAVHFVLSNEAMYAAQSLQRTLMEEIHRGGGLQWAVESFHRQLPLELISCDVCRHSAALASYNGTQQRPRLAQFFDSDSELRLCDVCCYSIFMHRDRWFQRSAVSLATIGGGTGAGCSGAATSSQSPVAASGPGRPPQGVQTPVSSPGAAATPFAPHEEPDQAFDLRPGRLAVYRPLDWGRSRRRWLRTLGVSTVHAVEGIVVQPFVGLRNGGLVGAAVGGMAGLMNFLSAPVTGVRHLANNLRAPVAVSVNSGMQAEMCSNPHAVSNVRICALGSRGELCLGDENDPRALDPATEATICAKIRDIFQDASRMHDSIDQMQNSVHEGYATALARQAG